MLSIVRQRQMCIKGSEKAESGWEEGLGGRGGELLGLTLNSPGFTWTHLASLGLTWIHLDSLGFTWSHLDSRGLTWTHLDSLGLT